MDDEYINRREAIMRISDLIGITKGRCPTWDEVYNALTDLPYIEIIKRSNTIDRDKVIQGLTTCTQDIPISNNVHKSDFCKKCPYYNSETRYCWNQTKLMKDALVLLKEQKNNDTCENCAMAIEDRQIIRCKDCIKLETNKCPMRERLFPNGDFYCADGVKKYE